MPFDLLTTSMPPALTIDSILSAPNPPPKHPLSEQYQCLRCPKNNVRPNHAVLAPLRDTNITQLYYADLAAGSSRGLIAVSRASIE
jgi:hypothetical protein